MGGMNWKVEPFFACETDDYGVCNRYILIIVFVLTSGEYGLFYAKYALNKRLSCNSLFLANTSKRDSFV